MVNAIRRFFTRTDWILLGLCLAASIFGIIVISSATYSTDGSGSYVRQQIMALGLGLGFYVLISFIDMEIIGEHQGIVVFFAVVFLAMLYPFGLEIGGNRSWMRVPIIGLQVQPGEYCKIIYIVVVARITSIYKERINSLPCILRLGLLSALFLGLVVFVSKDDGVALIYVFTFIVMALSAGFSFIWFLAAGAGLAVVVPVLWNSSFIDDYQKQRILMLFDESIDPMGQTVRYQTSHSLNAITGGGLTGQGLYHGIQTQANNIPVKESDFIFAVIGEELGFLGCFLCVALLAAIIFRIIYIGVHSQSYFYRQICMGIAGMLLFQVLVNIGMCLGLMPVIGLTLPFFSYGGSSMLSLFMAMGVISSVKMYPSPDDQQRYIQLPV